jgi:hypothetical protein
MVATSIEDRQQAFDQETERRAFWPVFFSCFGPASDTRKRVFFATNAIAIAHLAVTGYRERYQYRCGFSTIRASKQELAYRAAHHQLLWPQPQVRHWKIFRGIHNANFHCEKNSLFI